MKHRYAIFGAGRQGAAAAYDLALHGEAASVLLCDADPAVAGAAAARIDRLCGRPVAAARALDARDGASLRAALAGVDGVLSALPYGLNPAAAEAAIDAGAHFCDLGGNTAVVRRILGLNERAAARGVSLVPDCGLAPGLANVLAAAGIARLSTPEHVHIRCGGLPQHPKPPLDYKLVFHIGGLTNEYTGEAECLRDGALQRVPTLDEVESLAFPAPVGACEAFTTSGGTSTCCETWLGRLRTYEYKTVRYPGHCARVRAMRDLGLFDLEPVVAGGVRVVPRELFHACAAPRLDFPEDRDLVVLRVVCEGGKQRVSFDLLDLHDEATGFSAMERTTAYPAAATLHLQVRREVAAGARPPERCVPPERLLDLVRARGLDVVESGAKRREG